MYKNQQCLVIDRIDRIWNIEFEEEMKKIEFDEEVKKIQLEGQMKKIEFGTLNSKKK